MRPRIYGLKYLVLGLRDPRVCLNIVGVPRLVTSQALRRLPSAIGLCVCGDHHASVSLQNDLHVRLSRNLISAGIELTRTAREQASLSARTRRSRFPGVSQPAISKPTCVDIGASAGGLQAVVLDAFSIYTLAAERECLFLIRQWLGVTSAVTASPPSEQSSPMYFISAYVAEV
ncbi:hypothetical protein GN958_ATG18185 [Phytophthora infestans]|uniref:Uncharacterized protein n=1 Tax=Phytophthora infestans TaxID=4787 RepID=A0A8S9U320_PHYIN|nr:hypothetical protein GN958_ATG18185 [Phytophthora infestans]